MQKVIVYGLGNAFYKCKKEIEEDYIIVGYSDKKFKEIEGYISPNEIKNYEYDFIYITSHVHYEEIKNELVNLYGYERSKLKNPDLDDIEGIECIENGGTSMSEQVPLYSAVCKAAVERNEVFSHFRRNSGYRLVLEHVSFEQGQEYLDLIKRSSNIYSKELFNLFIENDKVGSPRCGKYEAFETTITISPTTLRYIKVLGDLDKLFGKDIYTIAEIGVGYGGQCRIIKSYWQHVTSYTLVDLPNTIKLAEKYLLSLSCENNKFLDGTQPIEQKNYDLVISNYAFSELARVVQDKYLKEIIFKSRHGYITWNNLGNKYMDGYSACELLKLIPNSYTIDEKPLTASGNCIIVW